MISTTFELSAIAMEHKINRRKQSQGRRKIEIKKIEDKSSRQVTFSKRRSGLFRKASELCVLCGAEAAIFVVSPKGKVFTFGHPSVEAILDRYEQKEESAESAKFDYADMHKHVEKLKVLEAERNHLKELNKQEMEKNARGKDPFWWNKDIRGMGLEELEKFRDALEELRNNVNKKAEEKAMAITMSAAHQHAMNEDDTKPVIVVPRNFGFRFSNFNF